MNTNRIRLFICIICSFFLFTALKQCDEVKVVENIPVKLSQTPFHRDPSTVVGQLYLTSTCTQDGVYLQPIADYLFTDFAYQSNLQLSIETYEHFEDLFLKFSENQVVLMVLPSHLCNTFILDAIPDIIYFDTFRVSNPFPSYIWMTRQSNITLSKAIFNWVYTQRTSPVILSPYDHLFKQEASRLNWNWRLLAALSFEESRFDSLATSSTGAKGLMQLMPKTGYAFGLNDENFTNPKANIIAGVNFLSSLQSYYQTITDPCQKTFFVLAAFHAGIGHVDDAQRLTKKYGYNPLIWENNVAVFMNYKADSIYAFDNVVKHGIFPGKSTNAHIQNVLKRYTSFMIK